MWYQLHTLFYFCWMPVYVYIISAIVIIIGAILYERKKTKPLYPLLPKHLNFGKRQITLLRTLELLNERKAKILLETGIARKGILQTRADGASTIVFGTWAKKNNAHLYSVDIDPVATQMAGEAIAHLGLNKYVTPVTSDSVSYLKGFDQKVDFLYLDSYDFPKGDTDGQRKSQEHHLKEFRAIENQLHDRSIVLIDDCRLPNGGKGKLVMDYLLANGWKIELKKYQNLLVKA